ncbi:MAG: hypothetical protein ACRDSH_09975 [Pseudonocardiaceae bacterium]
MSAAVLCAPLRVEQAALRGAGPGLRLVRTGMGPRRAAATAAHLGADPVLVAGVAGALTPGIHPGDVVVASEIRSSPAFIAPSSTTGLSTWLGAALESNSAPGGLRSAVEIPSAPLLAGALRQLGLRVHVGAISSVARIAWKPVVGEALAVDMESAQLAVPGVPFAVVRVIVDTPDHPLWHPGTLRGGVRALRTLRACRPALEWWAAATGPREIQLAEPRSVPVIAREVDLVLVVGPSSSAFLVEIARREGVPAYLIGEAGDIDLRWLEGTARLGIAAGPAIPSGAVDQIVRCLGGLGPVRAAGDDIEKNITVAVPREVS